MPVTDQPVAGFPISLEVVVIFDWLGDLIGGIGDAIGGLFSGAAEAISDWIFDALLQWIYSIIYNAIADFFTMIGNFGAEIFDLPWIQAFIKLFTLLGWALFAVGTVVAIFDVAIEYQNGRANIKSCCLNILKGFFACSLITVVPIELYKFCITLQGMFSADLTGALVGSVNGSISGEGLATLTAMFAIGDNAFAAYLAAKIYLTEESRKSVADAVRLFERAAELGNDFAEYQLGKLFLFGKEVPQDIPLALWWLGSSAKHGNAYAAQLLHSYHSGSLWPCTMGALRLLQQLARAFDNREQERQNNLRQQNVDRKLLRIIEEKRQAHGLKHGG